MNARALPFATTSVLAAVLLSACVRAIPTSTRRAFSDLLVPAGQCRARGPDEVSPAAMRRDLRVLTRLLRRGYGGYEWIGTTRRWEDALRGAHADLPGTPLTALEFRDHLLTHLGFVQDGHVGLWAFVPERRYRATSRHRPAFIAQGARFVRDGAQFMDTHGRRLLGCDTGLAALQPVAGPDPSQVQHALVQLSPRGSTEPPAAPSCRFADGTEQTFELSRVEIADGRGPAFEVRDAAFPWLRLRTLFTDQASALERFVATAQDLRDEPVIVLDMRRGGGGSDTYLLRWFQALTDQPMRYWQTDQLRSETTLQGALNFWGCVRASARADEGGTRWLDDRVARARRELREALRERGLFRDRTALRREVPGRAPRRFSGRLLLVIDRGCGSACETSVLLARQLPGALVLGENTEGAMRVGELRWYRLPESRVWISLGMRLHTDPAGRFEEGRGFLPDLWLDGAQTEARIAAIATCLADDGCGTRLLEQTR